MRNLAAVLDQRGQRDGPFGRHPFGKRGLVRYRVDLVGVRNSEKNRVKKLLEDVCIKLSVVAQRARSRMRSKIGQLGEALTGHFADHHRFLLARMRGRVDSAGADIAAVGRGIEHYLT